jgi:hypothetical protein
VSEIQSAPILHQVVHVVTTRVKYRGSGLQLQLALVWSGEGSYGSKTSAYINLVGYPDEVQEQTSSNVRQFLADHPDVFQEHTSYVRQFLADHPDAVQEQTSYVRQFLADHPDAV